MMRRIVSALMLALMLSILPADAQQSRASLLLDWIPADFSGFVQLRINPEETLPGLNMALVGAALLQPARLQGMSGLGYDNLFPVAGLLDTEEASFSSHILPWLGDEVIVAYKDFDEQMVASEEDLLVILPTANSFIAASYLHPILEAQDTLTRDSYREMNLYIADKSVIALTPQAMIIGTREVVEATIDFQLDGGDGLTGSESYNAVLSASPENALFFAYVSGEHSFHALNALLNGQPSSEPLVVLLGEALARFRGEGAFETALLSENLEAIGLSLEPDIEEFTLLATAVFYNPAAGTASDADFDATLLDMIPRHVMALQSGPDVKGAVWDLLAVLPLSNFAGRIAGGFPVMESAGATSGLVELPNADAIEQSVNDFLSVLEDVGGVDLQADVLHHFSGSYAVALLPRANDPTPMVNTPFDVLLVANTEDGDAALEGTAKLLQVLMNVEDFESERLDDGEFRTLRVADTDDVVLRLGVLDGRLVLATGSALEAALAARRGDNRLVNQEGWQTLSQEVLPQLYLNVNFVYNTFFPSSSGPFLGPLIELGLRSDSAGDGLYQLRAIMNLPQQQ